MSAARQHIAALDVENLHAIERGAHATPFSVLGVQDASGRRLLRVHAPGAWRVEARSRRDSSIIAILDQSQTPGLFAGPFDSEAPYLLRIYWPGRVDEHEDPYSFPPAIPDADLRAFRDMRRRGASELLGAHPAVLDGVPGVRFAVWAPDAASIAVAGDFNGWSGQRHPMERRGASCLWELFIPRVGVGARYCFAARAAGASEAALTVDPFAREIAGGERPAGVVAEPLRHAWRDERFLAIRRARRDCAPPVSIYRIEPEVWLAREGRIAGWRMLKDRLLPFVSALGFTHIQIGRARAKSPAWVFAPPPDLGTRDEFADFVDACHEAGLGAIVEWEPPAALAADDAGESDVFLENILTDSALHWLETFHIDGLSMRTPKGAGGLTSRLLEEIQDSAPGAILIFEDTGPRGRAGSSVWRADAVLAAFGEEAHTLRREDAKSLEGALLPLTPQTLARFTPAENVNDPLALLRAVYALAWLTPGMKLMHMGAELGQYAWPEGAVAWERFDDPQSVGFLKLVRDLNRTLRNEAPIRLTTRVSQLLTWLPTQDSVTAYIRSGEAAAPLLVAMNRAHVPLRLRLQTPCGGYWRELVNTDSSHFGGGDIGNFGGVQAIEDPERPGTFRVEITLPSCGTIIFRNET